MTDEPRPLDQELLDGLSECTGGPTNAKYTPTEREIREAADKIQDTWTDEERHQRSVAKPEPVTAPEASPRKAYIKRRGGPHGGGV